jgi:ribosome-associated toxin RatA of RatAB toxin-antitoxin module
MGVYQALLLAGLLLARPARALRADAPGPGWTEVQRTPSLVVFYREDLKHGTREVVAVTEVDLPPVTVFTATEDVAHWPEFMPFLKEVRVVEHSRATHVSVYERFALPGMSERDGTWQIDRRVANPASGGVFQSEWHAVPTHEALKPGVVRLRLHSGSWTLEPLANSERTRLTYRLQTDLAGTESRQAIKEALIRSAPEVIRAVRARADWLVARAKGELHGE